ncbi:reverse transcriptase domain protein [Colletotrichum truncatum]|uniref:Reverse transcriptase domain protein n=1 Tax=Colletotrichum truncatum TaxID=5467 RepID=A0ACC3ZLQ0_COLTU
MLSGANLPTDLWVEAVKAAAYLYNISPRKRNGWKSPCQTEDEWFRQYSRWWTPELILDHTRDLRPHWGWIYAYGCRAYPLKSDRERGIHKRTFKVEPRGHVGYLVGYVLNAHNLYRIWVPSLGQVIITRNVTFDENRFYSPDDVDAEPKTSTATQIVEEIRETESSLNPILEALGVIDSAEQTLIQATQPPPAVLEPNQEATRDVVPTEETGQEKDEGWLLTPDPTPEPESVPDSGGPTSETGDSSTTPLLEPSTERDTAAAVSDAEDVIYVRTEEDEGASTDIRSGNDLQPRPVRPHTTIREANDPTESRRTRPRRDYGQPVRQSRRARNLPPENRDGEGHAARRRHVHEFHTTFMPDQQKAEEEKDYGHKTLHYIFQSSVHRTKHTRLTVSPKTRYHTDDLITPPKSWNELNRLPEPLRTMFHDATHAEISKLAQKGTWKVIDRSETHVRPLPLKWVFTYKFNQDGYLDRCKARICVRGDLQEVNPLEQTYAATLAARTFRTAIAIAAQFDLEIRQLDVVNAFLNAERNPGDDPVICELPDGFKQPGKCAELTRALYGLRDAPLLWYKEFSGTLQRLGMRSSSEDECLFRSEDGRVILLFYVDDILVLYHKSDETAGEDLISNLKAIYEMKDEGNAEWYLGIRIVRDRTEKKIYLVHDQYIEKVTSRFTLADPLTPTTPLPTIPLEPNSGTATKAEVKEFQEKVGSVLYTAIMVRPDVAFAVAQLSRYLTNPSPKHLAAINQTIRYLYGTRYLAICFGGTGGGQVLLIAGDASFADDEETRRSSQGYIIFLFGGPIQWKAARQNTVTTSTTEAELLSLEHTAKETIALKRLFRDVLLDLGDVWKIHCEGRQRPVGRPKKLIEDGPWPGGIKSLPREPKSKEILYQGDGPPTPKAEE